jgi:hypothetical protein
VTDFRAQALALPEAVEKSHFGSPDFRVNGKIFAQLSDGEASGIVKLSPEIQEWVVATYPDAATIEPSWGRYGWTRLDWRSLPSDIMIDLLKHSWLRVAPKKMHGLLGG